jgi:hypothetical protein
MLVALANYHHQNGAVGDQLTGVGRGGGVYKGQVNLLTCDGKYRGALYTGGYKEMSSIYADQ